MADGMFLLADTLQVGTFVMLIMLHTKKGLLVSKVDIGRDRSQETTPITNLRLVQSSNNVTTLARKLGSRLIGFLKRYREMVESDPIFGLRHCSRSSKLGYYIHPASNIEPKPKPCHNHTVVQRSALHRAHQLVPLDMKRIVIQAQASLPILHHSKPIQPKRRRIALLILHVGVPVHPVVPPRKLDFESVGLSCGNKSAVQLRRACLAAYLLLTPLISSTARCLESSRRTTARGGSRFQ